MKCELTARYERTLSVLTQLAYAAAIDSQKWQLFVDHASELCGGIGVHLFGHDDMTSAALGVVYGGYDPVYTKRFDDYYGQINSWAPGFFLHDVGVPVHTEQMFPEKALIKTEFYSDWCQPQEDLRTGGGVILYKEASRMFALGGNIRKRNSMQLDRHWLKLVGDIAPHIQQALEINRTISGMKLEKVALAETRSDHTAAVIIVNSKRQVIHANPEGWRLLDEGLVVKQSLGGMFDFSQHDVSRYLDAQLSRLCKLSNPCPVAFPVDNGMDGSYVCRVVRHLPEDLSFSLIETLNSDLQPYFFITLVSSMQDCQIKRLLKINFDITNAEAEVVLAIARGKSLDSIAIELEKSIHTVRNQLKRAMSKLGISRQAELAVYMDRLKGPSQ